MSNPLGVVEPELRCPKHAEADEAPYYCADCNVQMKVHAKWVKDLEAAVAQQEHDAELEARSVQLALDEEARRNCTLCNEDGYRAGTIICDHIDRSETARRGSALVRAELAKIAEAKKSRRSA